MIIAWYAFLTVLLLCVASLCWRADSNGWAVALAMCAAITGYWTYDECKPEIRAKRAADSKAEKAAVAAQVKADQTPRVIREADGCKVYAFKAGDKWHYFTRCLNSTTKTDRTYEVCRTVSSGKTTSRKCDDHVESIEASSE